MLDKGAATVECEAEFRVWDGSFEDLSDGCFVEEDYVVVCWRLVRIEWGWGTIGFWSGSVRGGGICGGRS